MVVANCIPPERKRRLQDWGASYKEIPVDVFLKDEEGSDTRAMAVDKKLTAAATNIVRTDKEEDNIVSITSSMRRFLGDQKERDHFGFSGKRACMACLYSRPVGATQREVNDLAAQIGSPQKGYLNILRNAQKWSHKVVVWDDDTRGGKVYKLIYNRAHESNRAVSPRDNWEEANQVSAPPGVTISEWT